MEFLQQLSDDGWYYNVCMFESETSSPDSTIQPRPQFYGKKLVSIHKMRITC